ncbi:MAG TPA: RagB/SusD family nutrient uptake outer membrane protein [Saprospiraceae bacterium]|nr:RagB/SusD family nutrient uptake outer membrane protein [Saprospiraceae bacterium]HMQ81547.1 RagB/SusD family nutrient uptake outer membrane protein [Saprospiraceae bacterium]
MKFKYHFLAFMLLFSGCEQLDIENPNNPDGAGVIVSGADLSKVLDQAYVDWWQAVHGVYPNIALAVTGDAYGMPWDDFGAFRMGKEPREAYNNRLTEPTLYRDIAEVPWYGCLAAVSAANDVFLALERGVSIDKGGNQDKSVQAAAHFIRGLSWGYLALLFDETPLVDENTDLSDPIVFASYQEAVNIAVAELEMAADIAETIGFDFVHQYFHGVVLDQTAFAELCHAYAARFLVQWPRTPLESLQVNWATVLQHAEQGLTFNFAPIADGEAWTSYHPYVFNDAGEGPFWARVDQRLIAAMDPSQPARYPEVQALGELPLTETEAQSADLRLESDFIFLPANIFPVERGEWHYSHYQHNRNLTDIDFAGDGQTEGPMPAFRLADCDLLRAEAQLRLGNLNAATEIINSGTRTTRGGLSPIVPEAAAIEAAIIYERAIELLGTAPMGLWLDRRRLREREDYLEVSPLGGLQLFTPAQLPVPEKELRVHGLPPYSFGGEKDPEGIERVY